MHEQRLPELGENILTADIAAVLVAVGDTIAKDQPVIEVETEKATLEVPSEAAGRVTEIRVKPGEKIKVGEVILVVDAAAPEAASPPAAKTSEPAPAKPTPAPRASKPEPAPEPPRKSEPERKPEPQAEPADAAVVTFPGRPRRPDKPAIGETVPAAPSVRALARELGVEVREVRGSGPGGRITRDDVKAHAKGLIQAARAGGGGAVRRTPALPDFSQWGEVERKPLSAVRRATAASMATAWAEVPHVTQFDHADITRLEELRRKFNARPEAAERKLALTAIVVKMTASALREFPVFNASLDLAGDAVVYKKYVHIGVAVNTERGLLVPVIRDADRKGPIEIASELHDLAERARAKRLRPEEMRGAGFSVSNLGGLGTTYFTPIVAWPEAAILGVGRAEVAAVHDEGGFVPRLILPLSVSYDHRLIDGADAARFLRWIAEALEQPLLLLLDERS